MNQEPTHCKFCGAQMKKDQVSLYCPTKNCQWSLNGKGYQPTPDPIESIVEEFERDRPVGQPLRMTEIIKAVYQRGLTEGIEKCIKIIGQLYINAGTQDANMLYLDILQTLRTLKENQII